MGDKSGHIFVDHVTRFEDLSHEWEEILTRVGIGEIPLPERNVTGCGNGGKEGKAYRDWYTPKTKEMIQERYATHVRSFGYTF